MSQEPRRIGRQPNFTAFLFTGGLVGLLVGILVSVFGRTDSRYEASVAMGFFGLISAGLGVLVAGVVAVLLDRRS
ncbi:MAG: hypothetical protein QOE58_2748 [Actinomycetota bacterium]|nr:hypothetical protein [Actinomycetota bacterium]